MLDPLLIAEGLTKKQYEACDRYLEHTQTPEKSARASSTPPQEVKKGHKNLLLKGVADSMQGLRKAAAVDGELKVQKLEQFIRNYTEEEQRLRQARESSAFDLLKWLSSDWMNALERRGRKSDGSFMKFADKTKGIVVPYKLYLDAVTRGLTRIAESDTGVAFLSQTAEQAKQNQDAPGLLRAINQFILPDTTPSSDRVALGRELGLGVFGTWSAYFEVMMAHFAAGTKDSISVGTTEQTVTTLKESVQIMWTRVSYLADGEIVQVETPTKLKVPVKVKQEIVVIEVNEVRLKLLEGAESKLKNTNLRLANLQPALSILNLGLTYSALREGLREGKVDAGVWSSIFDMAESLVFFGDQVRQLPALAALRKRLHGPTPVEANALARSFGLFGAAMALGGSATAALDNYNKRDWDATAAEATQGVGAVLTGVGYLSLMSSPAGGPTPVGGFLLLGGALLSVGGLVWCFFATDTPYDRLAKFSAFGNDPAVATQAEGWALCPSGTFADWDPKTEAGLKLQLKAAAQLFYSFRAAGTQGTRIPWQPMAA